MTPRTIVLVASLLGASGVALGAFGAHVLEGAVRPERLATFETGVRYQLVHAVSLLALASIAAGRPGRGYGRAAAAIAAGVVLFSGSLYAIVAGGSAMFGMVAPVGGALLLVGWLTIAWESWRGPRA